MMQDRASWIVKNYERLKAERGTWENHWQEIADFFIPHKDQITQKSVAGEKKNTDLFDSTGIHSNELLASALHSMLTNPSIEWFDLVTGDDLDQDHDVRAWLQKCAKRVHHVLNNSNFQTEIHELFLELPSIGTSLFFMEEDKDDVMRFSTRPISEAVFDEDEKGMPNSLYRCFEYTGQQMLLRFGEESFEQDEINLFKNDTYRKFEVVHGIIPNDKYNPFKKSFGNKPFASIYVFKLKNRVIKEKGYDEFPAAIPRWTKQSYERYGRSPAMKCLPEVKLLNEVKKTMIISAQKMIDPPLQAPDEGMVLPLRTRPGAINYYRSGTKDRIEPLFTGGQVDFGLTFIEDLKAQVRQAFFIDMLQLREGPQMTATEVLQRTEEQLRTMGPVIGRLHNEILKPLIERVFRVMFRRGLLPDDMPDVLVDRDIKIKYSSMIARAQRTSEADNIMRLLNSSTMLLQLNPSVAENLDFDKTFRYIADVYDVPKEIMKNPDQLEEERQAQAELAMQEREQMQEAQQVDNISKLKGL